MSTATTSTRRGHGAVVPISKPTASVVTVDPATAARWLERNGANRTVRAGQVAKFAADMRAGRWQLTGAAVQFATDGRLLDGQHRLHAIVDAGVTVPLFVVRGLDPRAQDYMDTGAKRTLADQLAIAGHANSTILAAGARLGFAWLTGQLGLPRTALSDPQTREFIDTNPTLVTAAEMAAALRGPALDLAPSALCAAIWLVIEEGHDHDTIEEFFRAIAENRTTGHGDPRNTLSQRIAAARRNRERIPAEAMLSMIVRAFNAHYLGRSMHKLPVVKNGEQVDIPGVERPTRNGATRTR